MDSAKLNSEEGESLDVLFGTKGKKVIHYQFKFNSETGSLDGKYVNKLCYQVPEEMITDIKII